MGGGLGMQQRTGGASVCPAGGGGVFRAGDVMDWTEQELADLQMEYDFNLREDLCRY
jgi:hypothetical protein